MKVKDKMTPNPITCTPDTTIGDLWNTMQTRKLRRLPVLERGRLVGMVTRTDLGSRPDINLRGTSVATRYLPADQEQLLNKVRVKDIVPIDRELITISKDAYIEQAAKILRDSKIGGMPVLDDNGKLVGIITQTDIFDAFLEMFSINQRGSRINIRLENIASELITLGKVLCKHNSIVENMLTLPIKNERHLLIIRVNTVESEALVEDLKQAGFHIESVLVKQ